MQYQKKTKLKKYHALYKDKKPSVILILINYFYILS